MAGNRLAERRVRAPSNRPRPAVGRMRYRLAWAAPKNMACQRSARNGVSPRRRLPRMAPRKKSSSHMAGEMAIRKMSTGVDS